MKPENKARERIDHLFAQAGWLVQDYGAHNIEAGTWVAVRELSLTTGFADQLLYADAQLSGIAVAKKVGSTLKGRLEATDLGDFGTEFCGGACQMISRRRLSRRPLTGV